MTAWMRWEPDRPDFQMKDQDSSHAHSHGPNLVRKWRRKDLQGVSLGLFCVKSVHERTPCRCSCFYAKFSSHSGVGQPRHELVTTSNVEILPRSFLSNVHLQSSYLRGRWVPTTRFRSPLVASKDSCYAFSSPGLRHNNGYSSSIAINFDMYSLRLLILAHFEGPIYESSLTPERTQDFGELGMVHPPDTGQCSLQVLSF